jgi:TRAP transporter TAXI family solute receptor
VTAIASGGSQANIEFIDAGDAQLGFVQSDVMAYAYDGTRLFEETGKVESFSTVAALYMEQVQIVSVDPSITSVADLKGKNVSIGAAGSGTYFNALDVLAAYGMTEDDINPPYQSFGDSAEALQDGKIDAAFIVAGAPTTAVTSLATSKAVNVISIDDEHIKILLEQSPYYSEATIPADAYETESDIKTVAVDAVVVAGNDVSEADVYNFLYGVFENVDSITAAHAKGAELDLDFAASVDSVPYHPGAAKYFSEKGIEVPTK